MNRGSIRVLYVDSEATRRASLAETLESTRSALEVVETGDWDGAMQMRSERKIDCVIAAESLDGGTGIEFLEAVSERGPDCPTILLVDELSTDLLGNAIRAGVTETLPREPPEADARLLGERIEELVERHRNWADLEKLGRINTVIRELNRELVHASTRETIDRRVCEVISDSDPYVFAWIGDHDPGASEVIVRASAGVEAGYLEAIQIRTDRPAEAEGPTATAIRTHETQVMQNIPENPAYEPWREQALERGYRSSAAVPIVYDGRFYAVLNVYADRTEAFGPDERALFEELGHTIANAYHDVEVNEEARRFQRAVEQAADAIFIADTEGTIQYVNPAFEALTEFSAEEAVGRNPRILKSGALPESAYADMWETILGGDIWKSEIVNEKRSGEPYHAEQTIAPIEREDGPIEGFVSIQRDVTERNERTRELERYEHLWRNLPVGVGRFDPDAGSFRLANESLVEIAGANSEAELQEASIGDLWTDGTARTRFFDRVLAAGQATTRTTIETLSGARRWVRITALDTETPEGPALDVVVQDVTDLREKEEFLERAQEVAKVGWWQKDISADEIHWSDQIYEMWGLDPRTESLDHERFLSFVHPADRDRVDEKWTAAKKGAPYDVEHRIVTGEGELRWMREKAELTFESGEPVSAIGIVQDITDRKRREQALQTRTEQYEAVIENVHDGLVIVQDEQVEFVNPRMAELTGYRTDEIVGRPITDFVVDADREKLLERTRARLEGEGAERAYRIELRRKDGERRPVEVSVGVFEYEGRPATITAMRDITDRVDRTTQLQVMDRVLRHNLRNDMTTIQGYAETVRDEIDGMDDELGTIIETATRFMQTVDKEREIVRVIADQPEPTTVDVVAVCKRVATALEKTYPKAKIELDLPEAARALATDKLGRALEELLENAIVHTDTDPARVTLRVEADSESVAITVRDTGPGIPEAEVNVLTREYDVEPLYHGSGLGLSLVNWIIKQSNGRLSFEENDPRGSIVRIELERVTGSTVESETAR